LVVWVHNFLLPPSVKLLGGVWQRLFPRCDVRWAAVSPLARDLVVDAGLVSPDDVVIDRGEVRRRPSAHERCDIVAATRTDANARRNGRNRGRCDTIGSRRSARCSRSTSSTNRPWAGPARMRSPSGTASGTRSTGRRSRHNHALRGAAVLPPEYPEALVTVLFRPFPWEAANAQALVAEAEGALLLVILLTSFPRLARLWRYLVTTPYVAFVVATRRFSSTPSRRSATSASSPASGPRCS